MGIDFIFTWYQQKIGTYDKQKWETKIEQREQRIYGLNHIQTRSAKPNTDLIDLDLVRGSSFTKAKPKHGFIKVTKLATLRCIFYPFYGYWWIEQTSKFTFLLCLIIYVLQIINTCIYSYFMTTSSSETLSFLEIMIPLSMMWILCLIHSQIVATSPSNELDKTNLKSREIKKRNYFKKRRNENAEMAKFKRSNSKIDKKSTQSEPIDTDIKCNKKEKVVQIENKKGSENRIEAINGYSTESESETKPTYNTRRKLSAAAKVKHIPIINVTLQESNYESDEETIPIADVKVAGELTSSATDWMGVTTNSECSYSSDMENISDNQIDDEKEVFDNDAVPNAILNPPSARVSCIIWKKNEIKKADLSMLEISSVIIGKVDLMHESKDYFYFGLCMSTILAFLPLICKILTVSSDNFVELKDFINTLYYNVTTKVFEDDSFLILHKLMFEEVIHCTNKWVLSTFEGNFWEYVVMGIALIQRWILASMIFFLLAVAERTFKQRLLYAKLFSHLTSSRRAKNSEIPHFRLNKVINIKTWLSVRSYLKKRGPQRSVDVIVSTAFIVNLLLLTFLCVEILKDSIWFSHYYLEALVWCIGLGILLLRFMTLGTKINKKYRNLSVLITEQINLHLQIEQKPHKKDELNVANNVLKLAIDLLKELENPFKISGISANPILYNCTKLVILSALSGVFSEMLGFKLKLHKIKLK